MKIQCPCGTKYSFDVTPDMAQTPIRFVCQNCGLDSSDFVNELIRRELAAGTAAVPPPPPPPVPAGTEAHTATSRVRIQPRSAADPASGDTNALSFCARHPGQVATHRCLVCHKPICPKCMELFGYVCSPYCASKAEAEGIEIPEYEGKRSVRDTQHWRKVGLVSGIIAVVIVGLLGFWFWFAWIGSHPRPVLSVRFADRVYSGASALSGKDQLVFLHGDTLARYDVKQKKEIWSRQLIDRKQLLQYINQAVKEMRGVETHPATGKPDAADVLNTAEGEQMMKYMETADAAAMQLHVRGHSIWVSSMRSLVRYDWDTGKPAQEIPLTDGLNGLIPRGDELLLIGTGEPGQCVINHISLLTGESHLEKIGKPLPAPVAAGAAARPHAGTAAAKIERKPLAGLPLGLQGADASRPLDPAKVADQVQNLTAPARIALPALLASALHQQRAMAEMGDETPSRAPATPAPLFESADQLSLVPSDLGYIQFSVRMLEARFVSRNAMKAPPAKSVLDGNLTVAQTPQAAEEILNDMQRERGGSYVTEDESRYRVTVRRPDSNDVPEWTGEVIGPPSLYPLKTVCVLAAGKTVIVLDATNRKRWQATLSYRVPGSGGLFAQDTSRVGEGPCAERGDTLYVADEAVLTAFDLATGNVRWRIPSVGIAGWFFDDQGMMYVNTTTASPDSIKYSRQIDLSQKTSAIVLKIDPKTGKTLWTAEPGGLIVYVSGKYVYALSSHQAIEDERAKPYLTGLEIPSHVMIKRLDPRNGRELWQHYERRAPLDVQFAGNSIQLVFKKEVEVLRFVSF